MKKQIDLKLIAIFGGGFLFNYLFWMESLALNLLIYSIFIIIILLQSKEIEKSNKVFLFCFSHLLAALLVIYNQSALTITSYYISLVVFVGFVHATLLRGVFTALLSGFLQIISSPINLIRRLLNFKIGNLSFKQILKPIKYLIIPMFIIMLFGIIYSIANPVFADYAETLVTNIGNFVSNIFTFLFGDLSFARFMHIILGILFTAGILLAFKNNGLQTAEIKLNENLIRKRKSRLLPIFSFEGRNIFVGDKVKSNMALKTKNITGVISFLALNLMLLFLNWIDLSTLWLNYVINEVGKNYSAELHEGTNALIVSLFMAMAVIIYFFNGNLNFFSRNKTIKLLAFLWIAQNAFLVCSVMLRDYNYIAMHGLTYKRIGVVIFLILCSFGLVTVYIKVAKQKTFFYLCKINSLTWYSLLLVCGLVNWDVFIVNYNIEHRKTIALGLDHLLEMSDKTLPLLDKNRELLKNYISYSSYANKYTNDMINVDTTAVISKKAQIKNIKLKMENKQNQLKAFDDDLDIRIENFNKSYDETTWLSWNFRDWQTREYFINGRK